MSILVTINISMIIEDSSPYYVKYTHENIDAIVSICRTELEKAPSLFRKLLEEKTIGFSNYTLSNKIGRQILSLIPFSNKIQFKENRVSLFISGPGYKHYVHIDGALTSINYGIDISDNLCVTNWYDSNDIVSNFNITSDSYNRAIVSKEEFEKNQQLPKYKFTHKQDEAILFNTSIHHNFDNSRSNSNRIILTLRPVNDQILFEDVKKILF